MGEDVGTTTGQARAQPGCLVDLTGIPGRDTGPGGRLVLVARELVGALRRRRAGAASGTTSDTTRRTR